MRDGRGATVASFTDGARTVLITGSERTFTEPAHTTDSITTTAWIRLAPQEFPYLRARRVEGLADLTLL